jgi:PKD repeat protein
MGYWPHHADLIQLGAQSPQAFGTATFTINSGFTNAEWEISLFPGDLCNTDQSKIQKGNSVSLPFGWAGVYQVCMTAENAANGSSVAENRNVTAADPTPPVITPTITGTQGPNSWYTSNVGLSWSVTDGESAVSSSIGCDYTWITDDQAVTKYTCTATSLGGTNSVDVYIGRDTTKPVTTVTGVTEGTIYTLGSVPLAGCHTTDNLSGVPTEATVTLSGGDAHGLGRITATCSGALDGAGNTADPAIVHYNVTQDTYTLDVTVIGSGTITRDNNGPYHYGDIVKLTALPAIGWSFQSWSGDLGGSTNPINITINGNKAVTATFADVTRPNTTISAFPPNPSYVNSATFTFSGTDNATSSSDLTFECKLDSDAWAACSSPKTYSGLANVSHTFSARARDAAGNVDATPASYQWTVKRNQPPVANAGGPYSGNEGTSINLSAAKSTDHENNTVLYEWDLDNDGQFDDAAGVKSKYTFADNGTYTVSVRVTDAGGLSDIDDATVTVRNVPPVIISFTVTSNVYVGDTVNARVTFKDAGVYDTFTAVWNWDDGTTTSGTISNYAVTGSHTYTKKGDYTVTITISDKDGGVVNVRKVVHVSKR